MVGDPSFLLTQLFHATNPAIPANISFLYLRQFSHPYSLTKPSVQSPPTTPSIPQSFFAPLFLHTAIRTIPNKNPFSYRNHSANSGCTMSLMSEWVLCGLTLISYCSDSRNSCISGWSLWWKCVLWSEWQAIRSTHPHTFNLLSLLINTLVIPSQDSTCPWKPVV